MYPDEGPWYDLLVIPLRFELLCSIMIPISIKVIFFIDILLVHFSKLQIVFVILKTLIISYLYFFNILKIFVNVLVAIILKEIFF